MIEEINCKITGRVQMVMFRDFAKRKADSIGISGWVKNSGDGSVELLAQGRKSDLEKYIELLNKGPLLARVKSVFVLWKEPKEESKGFRIIY